MSTEPIQFEFKETLSGGFALGVEDPDTGAREGKLRGSSLSIHNDIVIADTDRFYDDAEHTAELSATVDFTPFGNDIRGRQGTFNLFKPSSDDDVKLMVYRFGFDWDGKPHFFEGKKYIHDGSSILKLWEESTHLYSKLYKGNDTTGPVLGAGIIHIGVRGVIDLVRSMRVSGADSPVKQAEVLAKFGKFFFGELWDTYRSHFSAS